MSYNITGIREKENSLTIDKQVLFDLMEELKDGNEYATIEGEVVDLKTGKISYLVNAGENPIKFEEVKPGILKIVYFHPSGEGSGNDWNEVEPILRATKGRWRGIVVWEGGDSMGMTTVVDGKITDEEL